MCFSQSRRKREEAQGDRAFSIFLPNVCFIVHLYFLHYNLCYFILTPNILFLGMSNACSPRKKKHIHVLPFYGPILYLFYESPFLDKVPPRMSLPFKIPKLNERPWTKYHNCNYLRGVKCLKNHLQNISANHKIYKITEENQ